MIKFLILVSLFQLHTFCAIQIIKRFHIYNECAYHLQEHSRSQSLIFK